MVVGEGRTVWEGGRTGVLLREGWMIKGTPGKIKKGFRIISREKVVSGAVTEGGRVISGTQRGGSSSQGNTWAAIRPLYTRVKIRLVA